MSRDPKTGKFLPESQAWKTVKTGFWTGVGIGLSAPFVALLFKITDVVIGQVIG